MYPLGDPQSLPGVTRRGRLDCLRNGAWVPAHVLLTHLSLLVFDPVNENDGRLLHHVHVTDILSILRHGEAGVDAPPFHHRCFALGGLDASKTVEFRASSARSASRGYEPWRARAIGLCEPWRGSTRERGATTSV